uniref:Predicted protein n=1 Tax=Hordeum vulgare subsp. vulgare TaxID=112509 RepID=F2EBS6_HORVV|nr:predicted protein [Hordeum vulgare subsp. vulgare]
MKPSGSTCRHIHLIFMTSFLKLVCITLRNQSKVRETIFLAWSRNGDSFRRLCEPTQPCITQQAAHYPLERRRGMPMVGVRGELLLNGYVHDETPIGDPSLSSAPMVLCVEVTNAIKLRPVDYVAIVTKPSSNEFIELMVVLILPTLRKWRNVLQRLLGYGSLETNCEQIKRCIQIGLMCVNPDRSKSPLIMKVIRMLQVSESITCDIGNGATT